MYNSFRKAIQDCLLCFTAILLLLFALLYPINIGYAASYSIEEQQLLDAYEKNELIRLHVIANSNSRDDQVVKYAVRDAIIQAFGTMLQEKKFQTSSELFDFLKQNQESFCKTAHETAKSYGFNGIVTAETGILFLPEKRYGTVLLPDGEYRALRITLGEGAGKNWWCILYPQLCLALSERDNASSVSSFSFSSAAIFRHWLLQPK